MNLALIIAGVVLPLLPLVLAPARTIGRGGAWKYVGAAMLVGLMMIIFFSLQQLGGDGTPGADDGALGGVSDKDVEALQKLFE